MIPLFCKPLFVIATIASVGVMVGAPEKRPEPLKSGPVTYFEDRCARCHGPNGSFYGDDFGKKLTDDDLRKVVRDMCKFQGDSPLAGRELDAQVAYHRALIVKEPFIVITAIGSLQIKGEALPKTEISCRIGDKSIKGTLKSGLWSVDLPPHVDPYSAVITAKLKKASVELPVLSSAWSHYKPIPRAAVQTAGTKSP